MSHTSRDSADAAGWHLHEIGSYPDLMPEQVRNLSWFSPATFLRARNGVLASWFGDPTDDARRRWVAGQIERGAAADFVIERDDPDTYSFMYLADTGEGTAPQYAVVPGFLRMGEGTRFAVLSSDVIYPDGDINEYGDKFFRPYRDYDAPIYAVPGNHDWYSGLSGFMRVFCDAPQPAPGPRPRFPSAAWFRQVAWKTPAPADEEKLTAARQLRGRPSQQAAQPGPYWAIDSGPLRIIGIDAGLFGTVDKEQGDWLRRVSAGPKPKILVTGNPIYANDTHHPCPIEGGGTVDDIVRDPAHQYVAAIGGDIHNYQHYPVKVGDRTIHYVVAGGGGAFMHATHVVREIAVGGVTEEDFRCYPRRGDSLAYYSKLYGRRLGLRWLVELTEDQAAAVVAHRLGIRPTRETKAPVTLRTKFVAALLGVPSRPRRKSWIRTPLARAYRSAFSPGSVSFTPPFFKSFLRVDVTRDTLRIRCFAATGYLGQEKTPPVEDEITIALA